VFNGIGTRAEAQSGRSSLAPYGRIAGLACSRGGGTRSTQKRRDVPVSDSALKAHSSDCSCRGRKKRRDPRDRPEAPAASEQRSQITVSGDTLEKIAVRCFDRSPELMKPSARTRSCPTRHHSESLARSDHNRTPCERITKASQMRKLANANRQRRVSVHREMPGSRPPGSHRYPVSSRLPLTPVPVAWAPDSNVFDRSWNWPGAP
jgi:hypothetical protein